MMPLKMVVKIAIVTLLLVCCISLFLIFLVSAFSGWQVTVATNLFGEGPFELAILFIGSLAGVIFWFCYIKGLCRRNTPPPAPPSSNPK